MIDVQIVPTREQARGIVGVGRHDSVGILHGDGADANDLQMAVRRILQDMLLLLTYPVDAYLHSSPLHSVNCEREGHSQVEDVVIVVCRRGGGTTADHCRCFQSYGRSRNGHARRLRLS